MNNGCFKKIFILTCSSLLFFCMYIPAIGSMLDAAGIVITEPLFTPARIGGGVYTVNANTKIAGKPFDIEIYIVNEERNRVDFSGSVHLTDQWVKPANPVNKVHSNINNLTLDIKNGYARIKVIYPDAGKIKIISEKGETGIKSEITFIVIPAYLKLTVPSCAASGQKAHITVTAVNNNGKKTSNYSSKILLDSHFTNATIKSRPSVTPSSKMRVPIRNGVAETYITYNKTGSIRLSAIDNIYEPTTKISALKSPVICFQPSTILITFDKPKGGRGFFYTKTTSCKQPEYVNATLAIINSNGMLAKDFNGKVWFEKKGLDGLVLPPPLIFTKKDKGKRDINKKIYSSKEQTIKLYANGKFKDNLCKCSSFSGESTTLNFRTGNVVIESKKGITGGVTRYRQGNITRVSRNGYSSRLNIPVRLRFNNGKIIKEDNNTRVKIKIIGENGKVKNSASLHGDNSFIANKGIGSVQLSDYEGEVVTLIPLSTPCLKPHKAKITFTGEKIVVLPSSGKYNENVEINIEVHDSSGNINKEYDGLTIGDIKFEPNNNYIVIVSSKPAIKDGKATVIVRNTNPNPEGDELFLVKPDIEKISSPAIYYAKVKFIREDKKLTTMEKLNEYKHLIEDKVKDLIDRIDY